MDQSSTFVSCLDDAPCPLHPLECPTSVTEEPGLSSASKLAHGVSSPRFFRGLYSPLLQFAKEVPQVIATWQMRALLQLVIKLG
jgi:hypothetical protein